MRSLFVPEIDRHRITDPAALGHVGGWAGDEAHGAFIIASPIDKAPMLVMASNDAGWDHASVSRKNRVPNWAEMSFIHRLFFNDDEVAMQLHLPPKQHINCHPYVLHLWRCHNEPIPLPPAIFV